MNDVEMTEDHAHDQRELVRRLAETNAAYELAAALLYRLRSIYPSTRIDPRLVEMLEDVDAHGLGSEYVNHNPLLAPYRSESDGTGLPCSERCSWPEDRCYARGELDYYSGLWRNDRTGEEVEAVGRAYLESEATQCRVLVPADRAWGSATGSIVNRHLYWDSWRRL